MLLLADGSLLTLYPTGPSAFGAAYNYDDYVNSACSSNAVQADKSAYWSPQLYWINDGGSSFTPIATVRIRFYYFNSGSTANDTVMAFPKGFRMLGGDPNNKTPNSKVVQYGCSQYSNYSEITPSPSFNYDTSCPDGLKTDLQFPSCWDGLNLWKNDNSHVAYPDGVRTGACPISHPFSLPSIMLEYSWDVQSWAPDQKLAGNLAWANGDTTGYGLHSDFANG